MSSTVRWPIPLAGQPALQPSLIITPPEAVIVAAVTVKQLAALGAG